MMKRIILTDRFKARLDPEFLEDFADYEVITAYSNEEVLKLHQSWRADLIITELYGAGMNTKEFCSQLRGDAGLRGVSVILFCRDNDVEQQESGRCRANAVLTLPVSRTLLRQTMQRLLSVPPRRSLRGAFNARRVGAPPFEVVGCRAENISVSGMLIETNACLRKGEKLYFKLPLALPQSLSAQAEVVRTAGDAGGHRYGVRFLRLDAAAVQAITRIVSSASDP